ncbi:unnamed protein product [Trichogramma brassicae]|uniref:Uncharacterized protein n=1 Tax=Trichogramma brassicae TaxID=86971 RepID=A0A6H5IZ51_9HYME|nr:unnamed protein product [Trichogramma brassicae]
MKNPTRSITYIKVLAISQAAYPRRSRAFQHAVVPPTTHNERLGYVVSCAVRRLGQSCKSLRCGFPCASRTCVNMYKRPSSRKALVAAVRLHIPSYSLMHESQVINDSTCCRRKHSSRKIDTLPSKDINLQPDEELQPF